MKLGISVWSDGPRKNWALIKALDNTLDPQRFELTLIGRLPSGLQLNNSKHVPPLPQDQLGNLLRTMDIAIAPSWHGTAHLRSQFCMCCACGCNCLPACLRVCVPGRAPVCLPTLCAVLMACCQLRSTRGG